jgi:hypothetical protein
VAGDAPLGTRTAAVALTARASYRPHLPCRRET